MGFRRAYTAATFGGPVGGRPTIQHGNLCLFNHEAVGQAFREGRLPYASAFKMLIHNCGLSGSEAYELLHQKDARANSRKPSRIRATKTGTPKKRPPRKRKRA